MKNTKKHKTKSERRRQTTTKKGDRKTRNCATFKQNRNRTGNITRYKSMEAVANLDISTKVMSSENIRRGDIKRHKTEKTKGEMGIKNTGNGNDQPTLYEPQRKTKTNALYVIKIHAQLKLLTAYQRDRGQTPKTNPRREIW